MLATRSAVLALAFSCLVACGGGGGGGSNTPPTPPPPPPPPTNAAPAFGALAFSGTEESDVTGTVSATDPDGDTLTFAKTADPAHGQIIQFQATGAFTYRPAADFAGTDTFAVRVTDAANHQTNGTVTITVANVNDAPTICDEVLTVSAANPVVDVLANDTDPDGEALTLTVETAPPPLFNVGASVVNGRVQLSLPPNFAGFTRFTYRAVDGAGLGGVATALVFVDAQPVRIVYATNEESDRMNLYVHDLIGAARRVSNFAPQDQTFLGRIRESANGRTVVYEEAFSGVNGAQVTHALWAAPLDDSDVARQITAPLQAGEKLALSANRLRIGRLRRSKSRLISGRSQRGWSLATNLRNVANCLVFAWNRKMAPARLLGCSARLSRTSWETSTPAGQAVRQDLQLRQASTTRFEFR